jgi:hypothetical protein
VQVTVSKAYVLRVWNLGRAYEGGAALRSALKTG